MIHKAFITCLGQLLENEGYTLCVVSPLMIMTTAVIVAVVLTTLLMSPRQIHSVAILVQFWIGQWGASDREVGRHASYAGNCPLSSTGTEWDSYAIDVFKAT